jgi:acylphosphatase
MQGKIKIRAVFTVSGFVQGVGFRYFVYRHATSLGLSGYANNLYNGDVEVLAEGDKDQIELLRQHLHIGPARSHIDKCTADYQAFTGEFTGFDIY